MKAVIFDFNGTLFFDSDFHMEAWPKVYSEYHGGSTEIPDRSIFCGAHNDEIIRNMAPQLNAQEREVCSRYKESLYRSICLEHPDQLHLTAGAEDLFNTLSIQKVPFTLATASILDNVNFYFETFGLGRWFDLDLCVYDDGNYQNKGEMQLEAARRLGVSLSDCVVIEDSITAISWASRLHAGLIIGIGETASPTEQMKAGAHHCIHDFTGFDLAWIK